MPSVMITVILVSIIGAISCYQRDELVPSYQYGPPSTPKSYRDYSPSTFVYNMWNDFTSMKEFTDLTTIGSPKELVVKIIRMVVSRLFFDLHSITFNFLLML